MEIRSDLWYEAIPKRRSRRQFNSKPIRPETLVQIKKFAERINELREIKVIIVSENPEKVFKGAIGSYGKIKGAQAYAALIGDTIVPNMDEKIGYYGETFILEATALNLSTCWVGGFFKPEAVAEHIQLTSSEKVYAVTPLGYTEEKLTLEEKLMSGLAQTHKRKNLTDLCNGLAQTEWPDWVNCALEAARLAPSAVNRQPWRFTVAQNSIKLYIDNPKDNFHVSKRLDCGIAMLHLEVGALHKGAKVSWRYLDSPEVAIFDLK